MESVFLAVFAIFLYFQLFLHINFVPGGGVIMRLTLGTN
jgi:hypothetical protein